MKILYRLERIGDDSIEAVRSFDRLFSGSARQYMRARQQSGVHYGAPAVWALDCLGHPMMELRFKKDYSRSNSVGSRGIYAEYYLDVGSYYHVRRRSSWRSYEEYYILAEPDGARRATKEEATTWAKNRSASTS